MTNVAKSVCPICGTNMTSDVKRIGSMDLMTGYHCGKCGDFVLTTDVVRRLSGCIESFSARDYDAEKLRNVLRNYLGSKENKKIKEKKGSIWFYTDSSQIDPAAGRFFVNLNELYSRKIKFQRDCLSFPKIVCSR